MKKRHLYTVLTLLLSFCGLANSAFVAQSESVAMVNARFSFFSVSLAEWGMAFFTVVFIFSAIELVFSYSRLFRAMQVLVVIASAIAILSFLSQAFVPEDFCAYCVVSIIITILIACFTLPKHKAKKSSEIKPAFRRLLMPPQ